MASRQPWIGGAHTRARQLWTHGLGVRQIRKIMFTEGWHPHRLPGESQMIRILSAEVHRDYRGRDAWDTQPEATVPIEDDPPEDGFLPKIRIADVPMEPDVRWFWSTKRCAICYGVSNGDRCPNGHLFPGNEPRAS